MADTKRTCSIPQCGKPHLARGLCNMHLIRMRNTGTTDLVPRPTLEQRFWVKVNKTEGCWNWIGATSNRGYGKIVVDGHLLGSHRVSYELANGPIPDGMTIDHACHNTACVHPGHLRLATQQENNEYRGPLQTNNRSGMRGVRLHKRSQTWQANVQHLGRTIYVGSYSTAEEADLAAKAKRAELFHFPEFNAR